MKDWKLTGERLAEVNGVSRDAFVLLALVDASNLLADYEAFAIRALGKARQPCPDPDRHAHVAGSVAQAAAVMRWRPSAGERYRPRAETVTVSAFEYGGLSPIHAGESVTVTGLEPGTSYSVDLATEPADAAATSYRVTQRTDGDQGTRSIWLTTSYEAARDEFCRLAETAPKGVETVLFRDDTVLMKTVKG